MNLLYGQEGVKLYHGDARNLAALADGSVQMVITSPPYFNAREYSQWPTYDAYLHDMMLAWKECYRVLCDGGRIAVNVPQGYDRPGVNDGYRPLGAHTTLALTDAGFDLRGHIIWDKGEVRSTAWGSWKSASNPSLRDCHELIIVGHKGCASRLSWNGESTISKDDFTSATMSVWHICPAMYHWHPAPFPEELPRRLIELYTFKGDVVLDPFGGSMTTAFMAARLGRVGIGVDANEGYVRRATGPLFVTEAIQEDSHAKNAV